MSLQQRSRNIRFSLLLFFLICIILFGILEVFLRVYTAPYVVKIRGDQLTLPTEGLLPREGSLPREGRTWNITQNTKTDKLDKIITVRQNSIGFRGEDPPPDFSAKFTLVAVGGSTTYNACISEGKTWIDLLGQQLKSNFKDVWINNAGFNGHSTVGHTLLMEQHIAKLKPKVALFLLGRNDSIHPRKVGIYTRSQNQQEPNSTDIGSQVAKEVNSTKSKLVSFLSKAVKRAENHSEVVAMAVTIYRNYKAYRQGLIIGQMDIENPESIEISEEDKKTIYKRMQSAEVKKHLAAYESRVNKLIEISRDNNIDPVLITQPMLYGNVVDDVTKFNWAKLKITDGIILDGEDSWQMQEMVNDITRKVAEDENVLLIELGRKLPKSSRYYIDTMHYSNKGNEIVADIIYDELCLYLAEKYGEYVTDSCSALQK